jgi:hypothetical protein
MSKFIRFTKDEDRGHVLEIGKRTTITFGNDWRQLFQIGRCNWYSFDFIRLYFEVDEMSKSLEVRCDLLGFGFFLQYDRDYEHSEIKQIADGAYAHILAKEAGETS